MGRRGTRKYAEKALEKAAKAAAGLNNQANEENSQKIKERAETFALAAAKNKLKNLIERNPETAADLSKLLEVVTVETAKAVIEADDDVFTQPEAIEGLGKAPVPVPKADSNGDSQARDNVTGAQVEVANIPLPAVPVNKATAGENQVVEEIFTLPELYLNRVKNFEITLKMIAEMRKTNPRGTIKNLLSNTESLIGDLKICYELNNGDVLTPEVPSKRSLRKKKAVPATDPADMYLNERLECYVKKMGNFSEYTFEFAVDDDIIAHYLPQAEEIDLLGNMRLHKWAVDGKTAKCLRMEILDREKYYKIAKISGAALNKLDSLSYLLAYLNPTYEKKTGPYEEEHMMELILMDQFPNFYPSTAQLNEINRLKMKEKNRRDRVGEGKIEGVAKPYTYLDTIVLKIRSRNKMARFYFFLLGYIHYQVVELTKLYKYAREITAKMVDDTRDAFEKSHVMSGNGQVTKNDP
ncbi:unnamed protein product [Caenorhabditis sp. 36 PRJEB53466]|nr:unnamed protein product [Caenorhabditis sp. 36 PRJEB53466]